MRIFHGVRHNFGHRATGLISLAESGILPGILHRNFFRTFTATKTEKPSRGFVTSSVRFHGEAFLSTFENESIIHPRTTRTRIRWVTMNDSCNEEQPTEKKTDFFEGASRMFRESEAVVCRQFSFPARATRKNSTHSRLAE